MSLAAVWNNFYNNILNFYVAPLVRTLWTKNESKAAQQFQANFS